MSGAGFDIAALAVEHAPALADGELPQVGVVLANLDGKARLAGSLAALFRSRYPAERLSAVVVDNGSLDGSLAWLAREHPAVSAIANSANAGFARASNQGARRARELGAEVLVFLNNDVEVEADFLRELVSPVARGACACTGALLTSWDGRTVDHAGGGANFQGIAIAHGWREPVGPAYATPRKCLFACGGAMAISAAAFEDAGGFDEDFFAYYEDLDLGWRLWLLGHEVHFVPSARARHAHSGTSRLFPRETLRLLEARNPLLTAFKNYADEHLERILPALLALAARRAWVMAREPDASSFRIEHARLGKAGWLARALARWRLSRRGGWRLPRLAAADFIALNDFLGQWPHWQAKRAAVQARRRRPDAEIFELFLKPLWCVEGERGYVELQAGLAARYGLDRLFEPFTVAGPEPHK